jgi:hypothetical protein
MSDANFSALGPFSFVFDRHRRASLFFAPNQNALDAVKTSVPWFQYFSFSLFVRGEEGETKEITPATAFSEKSMPRQKELRPPTRTSFAILFIAANTASV